MASFIILTTIIIIFKSFSSIDQSQFDRSIRIDYKDNQLFLFIVQFLETVWEESENVAAAVGVSDLEKFLTWRRSKG